MSTEVKVSRIPNCDFDDYPTPAVYDGKTRMGPWANMCENHFTQFGVGLGTGLGQRLILSDD